MRAFTPASSSLSISLKKPGRCITTPLPTRQVAFGLRMPEGTWGSDGQVTTQGRMGGGASETDDCGADVRQAAGTPALSSQRAGRGRRRRRLGRR